MRSDVHTPDKYGIYQSVGNTAGQGGVLRAMRTVPIYEEFARKIKEVCPNAWIINFTNPMSICTKVLYDVFPEIKAFGCYHEVFHAQEFLTCVLKETRGINVHSSEIYTAACGVNHFTWMTDCVFSNDQVKPIVSKPLPSAVTNLVYRSINIDTTYEGIKERDLGKIYVAFANQALCNTLTMEPSFELFKEMCYNTREYLDEYFDLD